MRRLRRSIRTALWLLTLLVPIGLVLFDWWVSGTAGTAVVPDDRPVSPEVAGARQYVSADGDTITSTGPRSGRVVLTFDDGPDPRWTPKVLDVLLEHDVTATFFVVGEKVVDHPSIVRRMWREGHEIANHTFTHPNMEAESPWRQRFELSLTDRVIAGVTGRRVSAFRLPYSSAASEATPAEVELLHRVGNRIAVFSDGFTRDYLASDAADIVKDLERIDLSKGLVLLLHDGGGDRSATVDALDDVITTLRARGADFVSLSESLGVDRDVINPPASWFERWSGLATVEVLQLAGTLRTFIKYAAYSLLVWALVKVVLDMVFLGLHQRRMRRRVINPDFTPSVAVIVPAYNEAESIGDALRTIAASDYPIREIVVVDDGSKDGTAQIARDLGIPNVTVIEQTNAGKAAALNRGVREATAEIVVCVDADTVFQADTVTWIVQPFIDPAVGAVSGNVKVGNRRSLLGKWQHVEYSYGQQTERRAQEMLRVTWCIPGAIGAFRRIALLEAGGFTTDTMAEDTDTAVQVHLEGWGSVFEPRSIAWTEVPTNVRALWRQRMRWHFGNYQVLWKQRAQVFKRPRRFGLLMMPYSFISLVAMPLALPIIDVLALVQIIVNGPGTVVYLWILLGGLTALSAVIALRTNGERIRSIVHLPMQQIVYRWAYIVLSLKALYMALSSSLVAWNKPARRGEAGAALFATTAKHGAESTVIDLTRPVVGATVVEVADGNTENELRAP